MEFLCFGIFLLASPFIGLIAVIRFLAAIYRTVKLISPEHRQLSPGVVWCLLIPGVGFFLAVWMVRAVAESLRRQFEALDDHQTGGNYGLTPGMIWACGQLTLALVSVLAPFVNFSSPRYPVALAIILVSSAIFTATGIAWFVYWEIIVEFKTLLESHSASGRISGQTQEEEDYGDDIGARKPENDGPAGTET